MKRLVILSITLIPIMGHATTMCVHTDSYVAILVKSRDGVSTTVGTDGNFTVTFDYFTSSLNTPILDGVAACNEITGAPAVADGSVSTATSDIGSNCWCGMTMPLVSDWVFNQTYSSDSDCASSCTALCANTIKTDADFRAAMFEAVW